MKKINCLRCNIAMSFIGSEKIQLGQTGWLLGDLPNLLSGALAVDIYSCSECGKIEFFQASYGNGENKIAQIKCPECGMMHDLDYPKCPFCKYKY